MYLAMYQSVHFIFAGFGETEEEALDALGDEMKAHARERMLGDWPPTDWLGEAQVVRLIRGAGYTDWEMRT